MTRAGKIFLMSAVKYFTLGSVLAVNGVRFPDPAFWGIVLPLALFDVAERLAQ